MAKATTTDNITKVGLIIGLLVGITALAFGKKKSSGRLLQLSKTHWNKNQFSFKVEGKSTEYMAGLGDNNKFLDLEGYTVLINSDANTNMVSVAIFGEDFSTPIERIVVDFIRKNITISPDQPNV